MYIEREVNGKTIYGWGTKIFTGNWWKPAIVWLQGPYVKEKK